MSLGCNHINATMNPMDGSIECPDCGARVERRELLTKDKPEFKPLPFDGTLGKIKNLKAENPLNVQEGGNHYKGMKIQPVEFIHANDISYLEGNVIKYVCRHRNKNKIEDLKKARHYIDLLIEMEYLK